MDNADATAGLSTPPDPAQDRSGRSVPGNTEFVLAIPWGFSVFAQFFGTARLTVIRARLARGVLRIMALQRVLLSRARRGRDTDFSGPRERTPHRPKPPAPPTRDGVAPPTPQKRVRRRYADTVPDLDHLP